MRIIRFYASDEIMSFELITVWTMDKPGRDLRRSKLYLHAILSCLDVCPGPGYFSKTRKQDCLLQGQAQLNQRVVSHFSTIWLRSKKQYP